MVPLQMGSPGVQTSGRQTPALASQSSGRPHSPLKRRALPLSSQWYRSPSLHTYSSVQSSETHEPPKQTSSRIVQSIPPSTGADPSSAQTVAMLPTQMG